jgi:hypothetical protein
MPFIVVQVDPQLSDYDVVDSQAEFHAPLATFYTHLDASFYAMMLNNGSIVSVKHEIKEGEEPVYDE